MKSLKTGNWGLKLLALILAILIYHTLKNETADNGASDHDRTIFHAN